MKNSNAVLESFNEAQSQLVVQTADLPLGTLAEMVDSGAIDLEPGFQRRERWSVDKQSALLESFLLNVPVPPVYLAEEQNGTYTAIDGKQRLRAIADFIGNRFALRNLEKLGHAQGFRFEDLPTEVVNSLRLRPYLRVVTLLKQTNQTLKYEVFLRLNRGGERLVAQEIRNVAFRGPFNDAIYELSATPFLKQQLKITDTKSSAYRDMSDAEFVLRFLTLFDRYGAFSGSLVHEMDEYMARRREATPQEIAAAKTLFGTAIGRSEALWGALAFKRPDGNGWRDQLLAGMYDAQMISAAMLTPQVFAHAEAHHAAVLNATRALFDDEDFETAVRTGTNTPARIVYRVHRVLEMLEGL